MAEQASHAGHEPTGAEHPAHRENPRNPLSITLALLAVGLVVRIAWVLYLPTQPVSDFQWYFERAKSIAGGEGYSIDGVPTAFWPVGYSAFLGTFFAALGASVLKAKLLGILLDVVTLILAHRLALRVTRSARLANVVLGALALWPNWIAYSSLLASEHLFMPLLLGSLVAVLRAPGCERWALASGACMGLAAYVRPQAALPVLTIALLAFVIMAERQPVARRWLRFGLMLLGALVIQGPWLARNYATFGGIVPVSTNGGYNLLIGHHAGASGGWQEVRDLVPNQGNELELDRAFRDVAVSYIKADPGRAIGIAPEKVLRLFGQGYDGVNWNVAGLHPVQPQYSSLLRIWREISRWMWRLLIACWLGSLAVWLSRRQSRFPVGWAPSIVVASLTLVHAVFFGDPRFQYPLIPFMLMQVTMAVGALTSGRSGEQVNPNCPGYAEPLSNGTSNGHHPVDVAEVPGLDARG